MSNELIPETAARNAIRAADASLELKFLSIVRVLNQAPELRPRLRGVPPGDPCAEGYAKSLATQFVSARTPRAPKTPSTIPDDVVGTVLTSYYGVEEAKLPNVSDMHQLSMAAENIVGELLERYLAERLEPLGWVWCSGSVIRSVDFILPQSDSAPLRLLQVKNRDNSENSSSSKIRDGTSIEKWFRSFSRRAATNWGSFPHPVARKKIYELDFVSFVKEQMLRLREPPSSGGSSR